MEGEGTLRISVVAHGDAPEVARIMALAGLSNSPEEALRFYARAGNCQCMIGRFGGEAVATGMAVCFGATGWIGNVAVHPEHRLRGFGTAVTRAAMRWLEMRGVLAQLLLATPQGMPVYRRLGFGSDEIPYGTYATTRPNPPRAPQSARAPLKFCSALDRAATGEDRRSFLAAFPGRLRMVRVDGEEGYRLSLPWGGGPVVATGQRAARVLLVEQLAEHPGSRAGFPDTNTSARALAQELGLRRLAEDVRMRRGERLKGYRPSLIYGIFSFATG